MIALSLAALASCTTRTLNDVDEIAVVASSACARTRQGTVHCWGRGFGSAARLVDGLPRAKRLVGVNEKYCVLGDDAKVTCFASHEGKLQVADLGWPAIDLLSGGATTVCGASGTTLRCRSSVSLLEGGAGVSKDTTTTLEERPIALSSMKGRLYVIGVSGRMRAAQGPLSATNLLPDDAESVLTHDSDGISCVRRKAGSVACLGGFELPWGGERLASHDAHDVPALAAMHEIAGGFGFVCGRQNGEVSCAGDNVTGQLGDGSTVAERPGLGRVALSGPARSVVTSVAKTLGGPGGKGVALASFACSVMEDGGVECWGDNAEQQLGDGSKTMRSRPVRVRAR